MSFPYSIIGHIDQTDRLRSDVVLNRVSHAYLFSGPEHTGKSTVARQFALSLQCAHEGCRNCSVCSQVAAGTHPDTRVLADTGETVEITDIREVIRWMHMTKASAYKICVIESVDRLSLPAQQSILKLLEEPPVGSLFILTTAFPSSLPPTIRSRARCVRFGLVPDEVLAKASADRNIDWSRVSQFVDGRPGVMIDLHEHAGVIEAHESMATVVQDVLMNAFIPAKMTIAADLVKDPERLKAFLLGLIRSARRTLLMSGVSRERSERLIKISRQIQDMYVLLPTGVDTRLALEYLMLT